TNALWPDLGPGAAGNNLRKAVHLARRALAQDPGLADTLLKSDKETISLPRDGWTDVNAFRSAAAWARRSSDPKSLDPPRRHPRRHRRGRHHPGQGPSWSRLGAIPELKQRYDRASGRRPYLITERGCSCDGE